MYHLSVLPPKQHKIPLIVSRQISIPNVSPNLTDAHIIYIIWCGVYTLGDRHSAIVNLAVQLAEWMASA